VSTLGGSISLFVLIPLFAFISYLLGSIPFGKIISQRVAGIDITRRGSGNIGATNVAREVGLKWGLLTLFLDTFKGFMPVFLFHLAFPLLQLEQCIVGLCALLGHQFSFFEKFRGGKGVATAFGIYLGIFPVPCLMALAVFVLTVYIWDFVSLGSLVSAGMMPVFVHLSGGSPIMTATSIAVAGLIFLKHKENLKRLARGEERRWKKRSSG
jgi:glycerol-3-phosphate acyltransferase PlsY